MPSLNNNMARLFTIEQKKYNNLKLKYRINFLKKRKNTYKQKKAENDFYYKLQKAADGQPKAKQQNFNKYHTYLIDPINRSSNILEIKNEILKTNNMQRLLNIQHFYKNFPKIKNFIQRRIEGISYSRKGFPNEINRYSPGRVPIATPLTAEQWARVMLASRGLDKHLMNNILKATL